MMKRINFDFKLPFSFSRPPCRFVTSIATSVTYNNACISVKWKDDDKESKFNSLWLRDNCQCSACVHPSTRQKLISSAEIPLDIHIKNLQLSGNDLQVVWNKSLDGDKVEHNSQYSLHWLMENEYSSDKVLSRRKNDHSYVAWDKRIISEVDLWKSFDELMDKSDNHLNEILVNLKNYGIAFVRNVPEKMHNVEAIAERFGPIRETFYGRSWDVKSFVDAKNIAYTSLYLRLHMDLMYFESPPGIQFLHVLKSSTKGGESTFVDSFKAVDILEKTYPNEFEVLRSTPVTFHYNNNGHHLRFAHPTITKGDLNHGTQVYYAPPFQGPLECPEETMNKFYGAFKKFSSIIDDPSLLYSKKLAEGDCVIFLNRRILHGRLAFDQKTGSRHLRGTYVDWDSAMDRFRCLNSKYG